MEDAIKERVPDWRQRLKTSDPEFEEGFLHTDLGDDVFYVDQAGRVIVSRETLCFVFKEYANVCEEITYKSAVRSTKGSGNWRDHRKRSLEKKRALNSS